MIKQGLTYLLVTLIAMQSFVAIADVHQPHQSGDQHLEFEHSHETSNENIDLIVVDSTDSTVLDQYDCHHCCHCHGMNYLDGSSAGHPMYSMKGQLHWYSNIGYLSNILSPDLRPPIV